MENSFTKWNLLHGSPSMLPQNDLTDPARVIGNRDWFESSGYRIPQSGLVQSFSGVISKRMVKLQQMRWTKRGAHLLLQVRTRALNNDLRNTFHNWYPGLAPNSEGQLAA